MVKKISFCVCLILWVVWTAIGQGTAKTIIHSDQAWLGLFFQAKVSKRWGAWLDLHQRTTDDFVDRLNFSFIRPGLVYYLNKDVRLIGGYGYAWFYKRPQDLGGLHEHRIWQQIWWRQEYSWFGSVQWIRLEQRFVQKLENGEPISDYRYNWRIRYNYSMSIPLNSKKIQPRTWSIALQDELFINFGSQIVYNYFDQNRLFAGLGYQFSQHLGASLGYAYIFQQTARGNVFQSVNCIRLFVNYNLDLSGPTPP